MLREVLVGRLVPHGHPGPEVARTVPIVPEPGWRARTRRARPSRAARPEPGSHRAVRHPLRDRMLRRAVARVGDGQRAGARRSREAIAASAPSTATRACTSRDYSARHGRAHRRRRPRVQLVPPRRLHGRRGLVEAHRRDLRGRAHRRGPGRDRRAGRGRMARAQATIEVFAHFCRPAASSPGTSSRSRRRRSATRRTRGSSSSAPSEPAACACACSAARRRRATATWPRSTRRRWPTASCSTSAAARCSSSTSSAAIRASSTPGPSARCA